MMDSTERTQLQAALSGRRDAIAGKWFEAIAHVCNTEHTPVEMRRRLAELTGQIITLLCTEPFDHHGFRLIGAALANLSIEPEVLDLTQGVLTSQIVAGLSAGQVVALQPRLAALFGGLGVGSFRQARQRILAEQEQIRGALMFELERRGAALRHARDELEQRVQARTAELVETNAQLRQEMAERVRTEEALRESEQMARALVNTPTDYAMLVDANGIILDCNVAMAQRFGKQRTELIGLNVFDLLPPNVREFRTRYYNEIMQAAEPMRFEDEREGIWFDNVCHPILDAQGKVTKVAVVARDITSQKQITAALQASEARFRSLFEDSPIALWEADFSQVKAYFNDLRASGVTDLRTYFRSRPEAVVQWVGLARVLDISKSTLALLEAGNKAEVLADFANIFMEGSLETYREALLALGEGDQKFESETVLQTFTGEEKFVNVQLNVAPGYEDSLGVVLASVLDLTRRKRAEEELRKHRDHLEELIQERTAELSAAKELAEAANRAKSVFLAKMSHELRTPLNAILGYAQILKRRPLDANAIDGLNTIQRSGEHLLTLLTDILDMATIETGRLELQPASIHIPSFLETIAGISRARAAAKGLAFSFDSPPEGGLPGGVRADGTRLRQVLLNLLDNAIKFTDEGQVILRVKCEDVKREDAAITHHVSRITFEVQDTGPGIPSDRLEEIFQPFEQAENMLGFIAGPGLGLAISRQLVRLMGDDLHVQSPVRPLGVPPSEEDMKGGPGSLFRFELTLPVTTEAVEPAQLPDRVIAGYRGPRRTLLVVDDIPSNRLVVVELLEPLGFEVVEAADGRHAVDVAQEIRPDLILMDHWMPGLNGLEAVRQMRQIPELADVPIIEIFSGSMSEKDRAQSREMGIDAFLPKPVSWPHLAALLAEHLKLDWTYGKEQRGRGAGELETEFSSAPRPPGSPAPLVPPPPEELAILHDLARRGNMRRLRERSAHIRTLGEQYAPFADQLDRLARNFEGQAILALIERYMTE